MTTRTTSQGLLVPDGNATAVVGYGLPTADSVDAALARLRTAVALAEAARQSAADLLAIAQGVPVTGTPVVPPSGAGPGTIPYRDASNLFGWTLLADVAPAVVGWKTVTGLDTTGASSTGVSSTIQSVLASAAALGFGVLLPPGRLKLSATVDVPTGTVVKSLGSTTIDLSALATGVPGFRAIGTSATAKPLAADAAEGGFTVTLVDASTVSAGDYVRVSSTTVTTTVTNQPSGEIARVRSIAGNVLTFATPLNRTYLTSASATVEVLSQKADILVEGLRFEGNPTATTTRFLAIQFDTCRNVSVQNCTFRWVHYCSVQLIDTIFARVAGCHFQDALETGSAYGVAVHWSTQDVSVVNCTSLRVRHHVTCGGGTTRRGTPRRVTVAACTATESIDAGFDAHSGCDDFTVTGCHVDGGGQDGIIGQGRGFIATGNRVRGTTRSGIYHQGTSIGGVQATITGNCVSRCGGRGILVQADGLVAVHRTWSGVTITGNDVSDTTTTGIEVQQLDASTSAEGFTVANNIVRRCGNYGILIRGCSDAAVNSNHVFQAAATFACIYLLTSPNCTVNGNTINGNSISPQGIRLGTGSTDCVINGNRVRSCTTGVSQDASSGPAIVTSNNSRSCSTGYSLLASGNVNANNL